MTVAELIKALREMPQDVRVFVRGYEDGVDDVGEAKVVSIALDQHEEWYYGAHDVVSKHFPSPSDAEIVPGVLLSLKGSDD